MPAARYSALVPTPSFAITAVLPLARHEFAVSFAAQSRVDVLKPTPLSPWRTLPGISSYLAAAAHFTRQCCLAFLRAKWAALAGLPRLLRKRSQVQRTRRVGGDAIWPHLEPRWLATKRREKQFDLSLAGHNR